MPTSLLKKDKSHSTSLKDADLGLSIFKINISLATNGTTQLYQLRN